VTADEVIVERDAAGFRPNARLLALWAGAGARQPLPPRLTVAERSGRPTAVFLGVFHGAFRRGLPAREPFVTSDGKPTERFLALAQEVGL
jgi:hypothetical protein